MSKPKLNPRQMKFVDGIEKGMSLVQAYLEAGYDTSRDNAYALSSRMIRNVKILAELDQRMSDRRTAVSQRLSGMSDLSTNIYIKIMQIKSDDPEILRLQQKTASDVLDRNGHKPKEQIDLIHKGGLDIKLELPEDLNIDNVI
jgi:hypothetical protein